jgi:hypothetical protein
MPAPKKNLRTGRLCYKCWGYDVYGFLGQGDTLARGDGPNEMGQNLYPVRLGIQP